ncbi:MAG: hypothetical protein ACRD2A_24295, partial [Vicinamibacterales bacterium]
SGALSLRVSGWDESLTRALEEMDLVRSVAVEQQPDGDTTVDALVDSTGDAIAQIAPYLATRTVLREIRTREVTFGDVYRSLLEQLV